MPIRTEFFRTKEIRTSEGRNFAILEFGIRTNNVVLSGQLGTRR
jgi:hypothetical protein